MSDLYIPRPEPVRARQWDGTHKGCVAIKEWADEMGSFAFSIERGSIPLKVMLLTPLGQFPFRKGDWLIINGNGVVFMGDAEAFAAKYEPAPEPAATHITETVW
jgi:hypothetical protein